jgi:hypothetical protein
MSPHFTGYLAREKVVRVVAKTPIVDGRKQCSRCKAWLPVSAFHTDVRTSTGLTSACKTCTRDQRQGNSSRTPEKAKEYYLGYVQRHPELNRASRRRATLKANYGVTAQWYAAKLAEQEGVCAICMELETVTSGSDAPRRLSVDHDHLTGENRGLLCSRHNLGIGLFDHDPALLRAAADYLERYKE